VGFKKYVTAVFDTLQRLWPGIARMTLGQGRVAWSTEEPAAFEKSDYRELRLLEKAEGAAGSFTSVLSPPRCLSWRPRTEA
jgi:hypothetical protein